VTIMFGSEPDDLGYRKRVAGSSPAGSTRARSSAVEQSSRK
jgi:hypothetical protein